MLRKQKVQEIIGNKIFKFSIRNQEQREKEPNNIICPFKIWLEQKKNTKMALKSQPKIRFKLPLNFHKKKNKKVKEIFPRIRFQPINNEK